jgi:chromosome segregation ATPase
MAQHELVEAEHAVNQAAAAIRRVAELLAQAEIEVGGLKADWKEIDAEIATITTARDPQPERNRLGTVCIDLDRAIADITKEYATTEKALSAAEAIFHQSARAAAQAALDWKRAHGKARWGATIAGFDDEQLAAQAMLSRAEMARTEREINRWRHEMEMNTRRVAELLGQIGRAGRRRRACSMKCVH